MDGLRATSWNDLQDKLFADSWRPEFNKFLSPYAFRGLNDAAYELETALNRLGRQYADREAHLLRNFKKYSHRDVVQRDTEWHWVSVAQHHGLPTRLLDWTFSPFVAMHFATANTDKFDRDGAVWAVNFIDVHSLLPDALATELKRSGAYIFSVDMLSRVVPSFTELDAVSPKEFMLFFEPPSIDERIINQFALFSMISSGSATPQEWLAARPNLVRKVVVPRQLKWEIRDKLDQNNITERVLFPGLDGLSKWLRRYYSSRT